MGPYFCYTILSWHVRHNIKHVSQGYKAISTSMLYMREKDNVILCAVYGPIL